MGAFTFEEEDVSAVPPAKLFKSFAIDSEMFIPSVAEYIESVEIVEGNGGPGTIKKLNVVEGEGDLLHRIDEIDKDNFVYNYTIIGGTALDESLEKVTFQTKISPDPDGGSVVKATITYYTKGDAPLSDEVRESSMERGTALLKAIERFVSEK